MNNVACSEDFVCSQQVSIIITPQNYLVHLFYCWWRGVSLNIRMMKMLWYTRHTCWIGRERWTNTEETKKSKESRIRRGKKRIQQESMKDKKRTEGRLNQTRGVMWNAHREKEEKKRWKITARVRLRHRGMSYWLNFPCASRVTSRDPSWQARTSPR